MQRGMCRERTATPSRLPRSKAASMPARISETIGRDSRLSRLRSLSDTSQRLKVSMPRPAQCSTMSARCIHVSCLMMRSPTGFRPSAIRWRTPCVTSASASGFPMIRAYSSSVCAMNEMWKSVMPASHASSANERYEYIKPFDGILMER